MLAGVRVTIAAATTPRLDIGRVIGRSFGVIRQRWAALGLVLLAYLAIDWSSELVRRVHGGAGQRDLLIGLGAVVYLALECLTWLRDTALTATALQTSSASPPASIARALRAATRAFPALLPFFAFAELPKLAETLWMRWSGASFAPAELSRLLLATGVAELVFAFAATAGWGLVAAVAIVEGGGPWAVLARAWRLASGSRWQLIAIYVVVILVGALPAVLAAAVTIPFDAALRAAGAGPGFIRTEFAVAGVLGSLVASTWRVMVAVAYLELRRAREGVAVGEVAEVFA